MPVLLLLDLTVLDIIVFLIILPDDVANFPFSHYIVIIFNKHISSCLIMTLKILYTLEQSRAPRLYFVHFIFPGINNHPTFNINITFWKPILKFFQLFYQVHPVLITSLLKVFCPQIPDNLIPCFCQKGLFCICPSLPICTGGFFRQLLSHYHIPSFCHPPVLDLLFPSSLSCLLELFSVFRIGDFPCISGQSQQSIMYKWTPKTH